MIKAIETVYNGYKFRSRLEARWAVFFDTVGIEYQYEPEGYDMDGVWYLPDFWFPEWDCWVEIKPHVPKFTLPYVDDYIKCQMLAEEARKVVLLIGGTPWVQKLPDFSYPECKAEYGIAIFCGDMLVESSKSSSNGIIYQIPVNEWKHSKLFESYYTSCDSYYGNIVSLYERYPAFFSEPLPQKGDATALIEADNNYCKKKGGINIGWLYGIAGYDYHFIMRADDLGKYRKKGELYMENMSSGIRPNGLLAEAFNAARQARFEHMNKLNNERIKNVFNEIQ